jgi:hypothetical protein
MPNNPDRKATLVLVYLFLGFAILFGAGWAFFLRKPVDFAILLTGNFLLFAVSFYSFRLGVKALYHEQVQVFLRLVYSSLLLKLFLLSVAAFIYIAWYKTEVNKPALFGCFGLYIIYTFTEVRLVMKQQRKQKNV